MHQNALQETCLKSYPSISPDSKPLPLLWKKLWHFCSNWFHKVGQDLFFLPSCSPKSMWGASPCSPGLQEPLRPHFLLPGKHLHIPARCQPHNHGNPTLFFHPTPQRDLNVEIIFKPSIFASNFTISVLRMKDGPGRKTLHFFPFQPRTRLIKKPRLKSSS